MTDTPQARRHQRTRDAILDAARDLVAEQGASGLSLRAVARRIDYSPAGLYEYFDSKDGLLTAVCIRGNQHLHAYLESVDKALTTEEFFVALMGQYVRFARENPELFTLMFTHASVGVHTPDYVNDPMPQDPFMVLYNAVLAAIERGDLRATPGDAFDITYSVWAIAHGAAMLQVNYLKDFKYDFAAADARTARRLIRGLLAAR